MSHGEVPPHSVLSSARQGQLEIACISLGTLFGEYPLMTVTSLTSEELPCCNPSVKHTRQNTWCFPVSSVIFFSFGPCQFHGIWCAWSGTGWCCIFREAVQKVCLEIKGLYSKIQLPWVVTKVCITPSATNSSMHHSHVQPHALAMLLAVGSVQCCP